MVRPRLALAKLATASTTLARRQVVLVPADLHRISAASRDREKARMVRADERVRVVPMAHLAGAAEIRVRAGLAAQGVGPA
jgi:hypothetical protein